MGIHAFLALCLLMLSTVTSADSIYTQTGFVYPVGTDNLKVADCGKWLTKPEYHDGCYPPGDNGPVYHIGVDLLAGYGTPVRAISDGVVQSWSQSYWSNDGTNDNIALLVRHRSNEYGDFVVLYGHVRKSDAKDPGVTVKAGETIGYIGNWVGGNHLHFGVVHPDLPNPISSGYGRWSWDKYGFPIVVNGKSYYDNGLIDPIDFIVHTGPDNYLSRIPTNIPNPITVTSAWFPTMCWNQLPPDSRCDMQDVQFYLECVAENSPQCAVDPSVWSAVNETGKTSGNTYGVGGDGYNGNPTQTNLTFDFDILDPDGNEFIAGRDTLGPLTVKLRVQAIAEHDDAGNWADPGKDTIEIDYYVRFDGGDWIKINRGYMTIAKLDEGQMIQETYTYTIPSVNTTRVEFKTKGDAEDEVSESDEGDNTSRIESFAYDLNAPNLYRPDMVISGAGLTNGRTSLTQGNHFGLWANVENIGGRKAAASRMAYQLQTPNGNLNYVMDDGVDELNPGSISQEYTGGEPFTANVPGWWRGRAVADYQGNVTEADEGNNASDFWFYVNPAIPRIAITDLWLDYDGKIVRDGGTGSKGRRYHPNVNFQNVGNGPMTCEAEAQYFINSGTYRDRDTIGILGVGQSAHERVDNDNIKLGDGGWRTYRVLIRSTCGEFPTVERTISFYLK